MRRADLTDADMISGRVQAGQEFLEDFATKDRTNCWAYLDPNRFMPSVSEDETGANKMASEEGEYNQIATNILVKVSSIAYQDPDFWVNCQQAQHSEIVKTYLRLLWRERQFARVLQLVLLKRYVSGLGICAYLWDKTDHMVFENVHIWDFAVDPHVQDWNKLRWCARRIYMPTLDAQARFGMDVIGTGPMSEEIAPVASDWNSTPQPRDSVELWVYHDEKTEAILYGGDVLERKENLYGRLPYVFLLGGLNPRSPLPLGDFDDCTGMHVMLTELMKLLFSQARNGGGVGWFNTGAIDKTTSDALMNGRPQGFIPIDGVPGNEAIGYTMCEPLSAALMPAIDMAMKGLDTIQGVSEYQRGVINQQVKFATEAALLSQQSGARGQANQHEWEIFVSQCAQICVELTIKFGGHAETVEEGMFLDALKAAKEIVVLERSTAYQDPNFEINKWTQIIQVLGPMAQVCGLNLKIVAEEFLKRMGVKNVDKYFTPATPAGMPMPGGAGAPPMMPGENSMPPGMPMPGAGAAPGVAPVVPTG